MSRPLLRIRLTLNGRPVKSFAFNQDRVTIGRDPGSDIYLDNAGVSREHAALEITPANTYVLRDVGSANGMFVNDQPVKVHHIRENDVVVIGKFSLWFMYDEDRRSDVQDARRLASTQDEGTTVLRASELQGMIERARSTPPPPPPAGATAGPTGARGDVATAAVAVPARTYTMPARTRNLVVAGILLSFLFGFVTGGGWRLIPGVGSLRPVADAVPFETR